MTSQTRDKSSYNQVCRLIVVLSAVVMVVVLFFMVIFLHQSLQNTRKLTEELLSRLENGERERKDLKTELEKMRAVIQKFSSAKESSDTFGPLEAARVTRNSGHPHHLCKKFKNCKPGNEKGNHTRNFCARVKTCSHKRKPDPVYLERTEPRLAVPQNRQIRKILWLNFVSPKNGHDFIIRDDGRVKVTRGGGYYVYCRLYLKILENHVRNDSNPQLDLIIDNDILLSALPVLIHLPVQPYRVYQFHLSGLANITVGSSLYVRIRSTRGNDGFEVYNSPKNNFGMFLLD